MQFVSHGLLTIYYFKWVNGISLEVNWGEVGRYTDSEHQQ